MSRKRELMRAGKGAGEYLNRHLKDSSVPAITPEITPEMIDAALAAMWAHDPVDPLQIGRDIMADILRAALANREP
jgi:hypothetical protein